MYPRLIFLLLVNVYYITSIGNIKGILTINEDIILFDPYINEFNKKIASAHKSFTYFIPIN